MTRANINFKSKDGNVYHWYWNGDQYPHGLVIWYGILGWISYKEKFNSDGFAKWVGANYFDENYPDYTIAVSPRSFLVGDGEDDYTYNFDEEKGTVLVREWKEIIFNGSREDFIKWLGEKVIDFYKQ